MNCEETSSATVSFERIDCNSPLVLAALDEDGDGLPFGEMVLHQEGPVSWVVNVDCDNCPKVYNPDQTDVCSAEAVGVWRGGGGCACVSSVGLGPVGVDDVVVVLLLAFGLRAARVAARGAAAIRTRAVGRARRVLVEVLRHLR